MRLISNRALREFGALHPAALAALQGWRRVIEANHFANWSELRRTFNSVDKVGDRYVFNIGGNKYRLVASIRFEAQVLYVRAVLTHQDYDKGDWFS